MRKCRKMISVIMLMVMLVSLLPSGALAAEAPTGATNEVAAVEEPTEVEPATGETEETLPAETKTDGTENEGDNETTITEGTSEGASVSDGTEAAEVSAVGETSAEVAEEVEPAEASAAGETSVEVAPAVEPVEKEAKAAGEPLKLEDYLDRDYQPPIVVQHKKLNESESTWVDYEPDYELVPMTENNPDEVKITVYFKFPKSDDPTKPLLYNPDTDEVLDVIYDLPEALYIDREIDTIVKNSADVDVGTMKITKDGSVTIRFDKNYVKDGKAIEGSFYFRSLIDGEPTVPDGGIFSFPGVGEPIRVYIDEIETSNIKITKANSGLKFENGAYKTTYTLKVTTEKGTVAPITIEDKVSNTNSGVYSYTYTDPVVEFKAAGSTTSSVVPASCTRDGNNWTITGLPKINVGDEYVIKYDATIKQEMKEFTAATHSQNKGTEIYNTATAKSGDASSQAKQNILTVYQELKKSYKAVDASRKIYDWTIEINKNKHDITGYTYKDKMSEGMELISKVTIQSASGAKDELTLDKNEFSYTFTKEKWSAADLKNTFTITYRTSHPTATKDVYNDGILIGAGLTYKDQGKIVVGPNPAMKIGKYTNNDAVYDDHTRYTLSMQWKLGSIILPTSIKAGDTFTYTDELGKLYQGVDANGNPVVYNSEAVDWVPIEGIKHYTYCKSIAAMLHHNIWITTTEGYYTYNTYAENEGHSYFTETGKGGTFFETDAVSFKITGYDADGNGYDIVEYQNDTTIEIVKFDVEIIAHKDLAVTNATMNAGGNGVYTSWVRYGEENNLIVNGGPITKITNRIYEVGHKDTWTAETSHGWRLGADMDKSAVIEQEGNEAFIKYTVNVHYDLLNYGVPVTLTDQRSFDSSKYSGGVGQYVDGSASIKVYEQWEDTAPNTWITQQANNRCFEVDSSQDKDGKLLFKFDFTKKNWTTYVRRIEITYKVKIIGEPGVDGDNYWDDGRNNYKVYKNKVSDEEGRTVEAETPVRRDSRIVDKTGTQLKAGTEYTKTVQFDIKINPGKEDLDPEKDKITLTDTLTDESDVASFDYPSLTLKDGDTGKVIDEDAWESDFDPVTNKLTVVLDDQKSYILTYNYKLDPDKIVEGYTEIKNEAVLNGNWRGGGPLPIYDAKGGIVVDKREISITKTGDSTHIKLGGAEFKLEKYDADNQSWVYVDKYVTGEENGTIVLAGTEMDSDVLYRLTETKAPEGYSNKDMNGKDITYYLVVMDKDENEEEARQKVVCDPEVDSSEIHFFAHAGGTDEIKNKKVGSLSVSKTVKNGSTSDKNKAFNFTVTLSDKSITGKFGDMTFDKGVANFTLKDGETKTADRIPVGTTYTVVETGSNGYTVNKSGDTGTISTTKSEAKFTNTPDTTSVSVLKVWDDFDDEAHKRPKSITVQLLADNEVVKDSQVTLDGTVDDIEKTAWQYTWENLPKNKDGKQIVYEVGEVSLPAGYTKTVSGNATTGYTITNSYMPKTEATIKKVWDDNNNNDRKRPETLKVTLSKKVGEKTTQVKVVTLPVNGEWEATIKDLPKYENGVGIEYIWTEDEEGLPKGYELTGNTTNGTITTLTNSYDDIVTKATVKKVWNDNDNNDGKRPETLNVTLSKKVGEKTTQVQVVTLPVNDKWEATIENLPKYENGVEIEYIWTEDEKGLPKGYKLTDTVTNGTITTLTNSYTDEVTEATVKKVWNDNNNNDGKRPETINVTLSKKVGETITPLQNVILPIGDKWEKTIEKLPVYEKGAKIEYIWTEDEKGLPEGYKLTGNTTNGTITTLTNSYTDEVTEATVKKVWSDNNNNDRIRPDKLVVTLNKTVDGTTTKVKDVTLEPANGVWEYTETGLPAKENGKDITYTWTEEDLRSKGYELIGNSTEGVITTLTNWHPDDNFTAIIQKVWDDDNDHDGKRPEELTVTLNKKVRGVTSTVGEVTLGAPDWKAAFANLPKKDDGDLIEYFWTEEDLKSKGYELTSNTTEETVEGRVTTLTNKHTPETINVYVEKEWDDKNDQDGKRPKALYVGLIDTDAPGTVIEDAELSKTKGWSFTFTDLPKYKKTGTTSKEITYDVIEYVKEGTTDSLDGYNLTKTAIPADKLPEGVEGVGFAYHLKNTYSPEKRNISVLKVWDDANNMDKRQPVEITVQLYADGASFGDPVTLKKSEGWTYTWEGLDKNRDEGVEIQYTVDEVEVPDGYEKVSIEGGMTTGYIITNKHDKRPVSISKVDITNSKEVAGATLQILDSNKKVVTAKDEKGNDFECTWTSTTEPKVIYGLTPGTVYTLHEEVQPDGYTIAADTTFTVDANGVVTSSGTVTNNVVLVEDAPTKVNVRKVDIANDKELPGATLQIIDSKNVVFKEWTSTEEDYVVTNLIAGEEYTLVETVAPLGFTVTSKTTFTVDNNNKVTSTGATTTLKDGTPVLLVKDTMTVVKISKTDITGDKELKGATLQILDENGNVVTVKDHDGNDVKCEWVSTDKPHVVEGLEINKTYTLREKTAPDGFTITTDATFSIDENNRITTEIPRNSAGVLLVKDKPTKVKVSKVDITGEKELQGATLQILDSEGKVVEIKDNDGNVVETCEWVSTKEPKDIVGLKTGVVYTLCETIAPDGYTIATEFQFTIAADGTVTCTGKTTTAEDGTTVLLVEDAPTKVYISKTDINSGDELPGATLQILDEEENVIVIKDNDGNPVETLEWVSGEEPKYIEGLPTGVNYILRETISPDGYTIASDTKFTIDEKGVVTSDGTTSVAEDGTTVLVVEDDLTTVQISKVDTESGKELEGAKLQIIDEEGKVVEEWTSTKEVHVVRGLVANKKYILRETVAPLGYTLTTDTTFSIDMHNVVTSTGPVNKDGVILVNDTMTEVEILKVDSKTGKGLAGAKLQVLDDNGAVCDEWKSTKDAHKIRGLYTGVKYTLHEVEAPKGYDKAKDITFTIDTAGKVSSDALDNGKIVMKDTPTPKKNKTGDEANGSLWALLLMMASGALGGTVWFKRKRRV